MATGFAAGQEQWRSRLGTLRQVVRQELVSRQLAARVPAGAVLRVLDLGCGQGTQAIRLARAGHDVTGLDSSAELLADLDAAVSDDAATRGRIRTVLADLAETGRLFPPASFDLVLCQGVLMYLDDPDPVLAAIATVLRPGGTVSLLVRNGDALALRPGLRGDWAGAAAAFDTTGYGNRIGVSARADRLDDLSARLDRAGLAVTAHYGVRIFTDTAADDAPLPPDDELDALLACEERAGRADPYRRVAALTHLFATSA